MPLPNALNSSTTSGRYIPTSWQPTPVHIPKLIYCLYIFILQTAPLANIKNACYTEAIKNIGGSKNKTKTVKATVDFAAQIAEKQSAKEAAAAEIASITANIDTLKADLKTKKAELKSIDKEIARIEAKKVKAETKAAESAKKAEAEDVLKKLLASGVSADDILAKLK